MSKTPGSRSRVESVQERNLRECSDIGFKTGPNRKADFRVDPFLGVGSSVQTTVLSQGTTNNLTPGAKDRTTTGLLREFRNGASRTVVPSNEVPLYVRLFRPLSQSVVLPSVLENFGLLPSL